jgi:oligosaccharide repeat unit polymerase
MDSVIFIQLLLLAILTLIVIYSLLKSKTIDIFQPLYVFSLAYIIYLFFGSLSVLQDQYTISSQQWTYYLLGLIFFSMGCSIPLIKSMLGKQEISQCKKKWNARKLAVTIAVIFCLGVAARSLIYLKSGIPLLSTNILATRLDASASGYLGEIAMSTEIVFMSAAAGLMLFRKYRFTFAILLVLSFVLALFSGTRTSLIRQVVPAIILFHYTVKKIPLKAAIVMVMISLLFVGSMNFVRIYRMWGPATLDDLAQRNYKPAFYWIYYVFRDFKHGPEGFARVLEMIPSQYGYQWGTLHASPLLMPLPGKQLPPGVILKDFASLEFVGVGMPTTMLGVQYADFGLIGIMAGMFLVGLVYEHVYLLARRRKHPFHYLVLGAITITLILGIRTDYLNFEILWTIILLAIIHFFASSKGLPTPSIEE